MDDHQRYRRGWFQANLPMLEGRPFDGVRCITRESPAGVKFCLTCVVNRAIEFFKEEVADQAHQIKQLRAEKDALQVKLNAR